MYHAFRWRPSVYEVLTIAYTSLPLRLRLARACACACPREVPRATPEAWGGVGPNHDLTLQGPEPRYVTPQGQVTPICGPSGSGYPDM